VNIGVTVSFLVSDDLSSTRMVGEKTTRELIYETNRDVKWICDALQRMEALEAWRAETGR